MRRLIDPLYEQPLLEVRWAAEDALGFDLAVTADGQPCGQAWGNVVLVANGVADDGHRSRFPRRAHPGRTRLCDAVPGSRRPSPATRRARLRSLYHHWREQV